jgi:transposase
MPDRSIMTDVAEIAEASGNEGVQGHTQRPTSSLDAVRRARQRARRVEAVSLRLAGISTEAIAERMGISRNGVQQLVEKTLATAENLAAEEMRTLENIRLDRAQSAIWAKVLAGDTQAITAFLQISARRSKMNGLDAPTSIVISPNVRMEMERALAELQSMMETVEGEVVGPVTDELSD